MAAPRYYTVSWDQLHRDGKALACRLVDILDLAGVVVPPNPGNVSAFGLLTVDVKNDYVQTAVARESTLDYAAIDTTFAALTERAAAALDKEGFAAQDHHYVRTVDLRFDGQVVTQEGAPTDSTHTASPSTPDAK